MRPVCLQFVSGFGVQNLGILYLFHVCSETIANDSNVNHSGRTIMNGTTKSLYKVVWQLVKTLFVKRQRATTHERCHHDCHTLAVFLLTPQIDEAAQRSWPSLQSFPFDWMGRKRDRAHCDVLDRSGLYCVDETTREKKVDTALSAVFESAVFEFSVFEFSVSL